MTIHVTQEHLDNGHKASCGACPVHLALRPFFTLDADEFTVYQTAVYIDDPGIDCWAFNLPGTASNNVCRFDRGEPVAPFSFTLSAENFIIP